MDELEKMKQENADLKSALNYERSERKRLSKELSTKDDDTEDIKKAEAQIRAKLKEGKSQFSDETIDDLMSTFGSEQAKAQVRTAKQNIEKEIMELKRNPTYIDVEEYGSEIRTMMKKGLSAEQAYWAVYGEQKYSNSKAQEITQKEEQKEKEKNKERVQEGYVDTGVTGEPKKEQYTAKERAIADTLGISPEEAKARSKETFSIKELLNMNEKFKKGE